jgi:hypothetical protein
MPADDDSDLPPQSAEPAGYTRRPTKEAALTKHILAWVLMGALGAYPGVVAVAFAAPPVTSGSEAEALVERMLEALGGRERWARLRNTVNDSQQNRATAPTVVRAVITMDFERPRFRIETTGPDLHVIRAVDGEAHWRLTRDGRVEPVPADVLAEDLQWHSSHVYRTIHRLARRDPDLFVSVGDDGRLEVRSRALAERIAWFRLDDRGEPFGFGGAGDGPGTLSGPWDFERDGIRHPVWVSSPDGTWRARLLDLALDVPLPPELFARPGAPGGPAVE